MGVLGDTHRERRAQGVRQALRTFRNSWWRKSCQQRGQKEQREAEGEMGSCAGGAVGGKKEVKEREVDQIRSDPVERSGNASNLASLIFITLEF